MSEMMPRMFVIGAFSISLFSACQSLPESSSLIVPPHPSVSPENQTNPSVLPPSSPPTLRDIPTSTPLPNPDQVPHQQQPSPGPLPYPIPHLIPIPDPYQPPNPWPTNIGLRYEGDPIPTPPPEPTPHPGDCGFCKVHWSTIHHPVWAGNKLIYFQNQHSTLFRSLNSNTSEFKLYQSKPGQIPEELDFHPPLHQLDILSAISENQLLYLNSIGQEPNLFRLDLSSTPQLVSLSSDQVLYATLNQDQSQLAWISYENGHQNIPFYVSSLSDIKPTLIGRLPSSGVNKLSWMPDQTGWAFIQSDYNNPYKTEIQKFDKQGKQNLWLSVPRSGVFPEKILNFKFSPDGKHLAIVLESLTVSQGNKGTYWKGILWLGSADGKNLKQISSLGRVDADFDWSPDSSKLVVAAGTGEAEKPEAIDLYTVNAETTSLQRLTNSSQNPKWQQTQPRWSPDGQYISFISNRDADFKLNLYIPTGLYLIQPDGTGLKTVTKGSYSTESISPPPADTWL